MSVSTPQAYVGATLIDGLGHDPIEKSVLVIENGVIVAIGQAGSVTIPENARKIDVDGLTLTHTKRLTYESACNPIQVILL